jgi:hypothetical protein
MEPSVPIDYSLKRWTALSHYVTNQIADWKTQLESKSSPVFGKVPASRPTRTSRPCRPRLGHLLFFAGDNIGVRKLSEFFTHKPGANTGFLQPIE